MRGPQRPHIVVLLVVLVWALSSVAYLGREDGSAGLTLIGWAHAVFFLPGISVLKLAGGPVGNGDLPLAACLSWVLYSGVAAGFVQLVVVIRRASRPGDGGAPRRS